jgi:cold shock CspA family protein
VRQQGRISEWRNERGFGFITPDGGGPRVFLHISSFPYRSRRPAVGELITYELGTDERGRPRANAAKFVGASAHKARLVNALVSTVTALFVVVFLGYVAYVRISHPNSTVSASVYKLFFAREALHQDSRFRCDPAKSSCARMSSCAEAFFHQERCGVSNMDGDQDGIPCEQQWCN